MIDNIPGEAIAEALRIAERRLDRSGWKYSAADIGKVAREILDRLQEEPNP